jgi:hypothetical protein
VTSREKKIFAKIFFENMAKKFHVHRFAQHADQMQTQNVFDQNGSFSVYNDLPANPL